MLPTFLEATLVMSILGRRYGRAYFWTAFVTVASFVAFTLAVVQRRVAPTLTLTLTLTLALALTPYP